MEARALMPRRHSGETSGLLPPAIVTWAATGFWAILDQGFFALSNLLISIALARWLTPWDYGAFAVAFSVFLFIGAVHFALLIEPMLVFGSARYAGRGTDYLNVLVLAHWVSAGPVCLALLVLGSLLGLQRPSALCSALMGFAVAGPLMLLTWLMRRACYLRPAPRLSALAGLLHLTFIAAGLFALHHQRWLSISSALGLLAAASLVTSLWLSIRLGVGVSFDTQLVRDVLRAHWGYGRWAAATMALVWVPAESYFLFLPLWHGLDATAVLKALANLTMPARNAHIAVGILALPALASVRGTVGFGRMMSLAMVALTLGSALYWVPVVLFHRPLLAWLYGGRYAAPPEVLVFLGLYLLSSALADTFGAGLRALERPDLVFRANVFAAAVTVTLGLWALAHWGIVGAAGGIALSAATRALAMQWCYREEQADARAALRLERLNP